MKERRYIGIDMGAETIKVAEIVCRNEERYWTRSRLEIHRKEPGVALLTLLREWDWNQIAGVSVCGRLSRQADLPRIPVKQAQTAAFRYLFGNGPGTVVSVGSNGFSVLEIRANGMETLRENGRCSQGTGNFLRQLVGRFGLNVEEADEYCREVTSPALLSGRCPVILKTDLTHLANQGHSRREILAGLFDAVCDNIQMHLKPRVSPPRVVLTGGLAQSLRIRENIKRFLEGHGMELVEFSGEKVRFLEALGCALLASEETDTKVPPLQRILTSKPSASFDRVPPLFEYLDRVRRIEPSPVAGKVLPNQIMLGFDIGSTGSKLAAVDSETKEMIWDAYLCTKGDPVVAAQSLMRLFVEGPACDYPVVGIGVTGSGRAIVATLMTICYGAEAVFVMNEIVAHAEGALHHDPRVDTIFEIGGQDAKYIRLVDGRILDSAMNEACSAGTGSFIEEQGERFSEFQDLIQMSEEAMQAESGVSLGQHCSVFMAEIIDQAVAAGIEQRSIIAGIYDSVIQNYLNRVKGTRSVGKVVFCQGKPFTADALAAAVARQTGTEVIIPPNPGAMGAHGIGLLAMKNNTFQQGGDYLDPQRFLEAEVNRKTTFVCKSKVGCGGAGNRCRIDRLTTTVEKSRSSFTWGGSCSLFDQGVRRSKVLDGAPDPFTQRQELIDKMLAEFGSVKNRRRVAITDEFQLKGIFPFYAAFFNALGFELCVPEAATDAHLRRGIEEANVRFCAPMQQYQGLANSLAEEPVDFLFLPMVRSLPRAAGEPDGVVCPTVQASPDLVRLNLPEGTRHRVLSPVIDVGAEGLYSKRFADGCRRLAKDAGRRGRIWKRAFEEGRTKQERFEQQCLELGEAALEFCRGKGVVPVVVLGRPYTIYNNVLNSNVPSLLRQQGAMAIPIDCYPVGTEVPTFDRVFWAQGQRILRAAHQIRRTRGVYSVYCSNYSCGPDSFLLHFYSYIMEGKPFAVLETDGHMGDAGTKTRIEAFLHCVEQDRTRQNRAGNPRDLRKIQGNGWRLGTVPEGRLLIPRMGPGAEALAACFRGVGVRAEVLPMPNRETVVKGRRYTSGKECVPLCVTTGSLLQRLEVDGDKNGQFTLMMPTARGPCRFGVYNMLHRAILEHLGWEDQVEIWSPEDSGYFDGFPPGFSTLVFSGVMAADLLLDCLHYVRPVEKHAGAAERLYTQYQQELIKLLERQAQRQSSLKEALFEVGTKRLFGVMDLLQRAGGHFQTEIQAKSLPTVLLVGEIYVRSDPFTNDFI
ncbi:MAG: CoA activase, partial [Acidobacteriota bacterium]